MARGRKGVQRYPLKSLTAIKAETVQNLGVRLPMPIVGVGLRQARSAAQTRNRACHCDGAADLQQQAGAAPCPSHLLGFIHLPVDGE